MYALWSPQSQLVPTWVDLVDVIHAHAGERVGQFLADWYAPLSIALASSAVELRRALGRIETALSEQKNSHETALNFIRIKSISMKSHS